MSSRRRLRNFDWIAGAFAIVALAGVSASGQNEAAVIFAARKPTIADLQDEIRQNYQTVLVSELRFCRSACALSTEQSQKIAARAGVLIEPAVLDSAKAQERAQKQGGIRRANEPVPPDKVEVVRSVLQKLVSEYATPEQQARYQAEKTKRAARVKATAIDALVARLDRLLVLSSGQRAQLLKVFESNWDGEWGVIHSIMGDDDGPLPAIPERLIVPCLSPTQERLWRRYPSEGIDATEAYVLVLCEIMEGLPSEFEATLAQAAKEPAKAPTGKAKDEVPKQKP